MNQQRTTVCLAAMGIGTLGLASMALGDVPIRAQRLATGLGRPVFVASPTGDMDHLFIVEQHSGNIKIMNLANNTINATPFLTISTLTRGNEQGLLGLAFSPDYATNGQFYVNYTNPSGNTVVARYTRSTANALVADATTAQTVMTFAQPESNHNGGWLGFGPTDGYLYIGAGDGGGANDIHGTFGNGQNTETMLGKMLRVDVTGDDFPTDANKNYRIPVGGPNPTDPPKNPFAQGYNQASNPAGLDEIWHYGLRNPFRNAFDPKTGALWIGDVGQDTREEIDYQPANSQGGMNFGWRVREGFIAHPNANLAQVTPVSPVDPIFDYPHNNTTGGFSVTGGVVYRGTENPALDGAYFFADYSTAKIWKVKYDGTGTPVISLVQNPQASPVMNILTDAGTINNISSFGVDALGRMYITDLGTAVPNSVNGELYRLIPAMPGDANLDRIVNYLDYVIVRDNFELTGLKSWSQGDFNDDGVVDFRDYQILEVNFGRALPIGADVPGGADLTDGVSVPEPGAIGLLLTIGAGTWLRRRRVRGL